MAVSIRPAAGCISGRGLTGKRSGGAATLFCRQGPMPTIRATGGPHEIYDDAGGEPLGVRLVGTGGRWKRYHLYRRVPPSGQMTLTVALTVGDGVIGTFNVESPQPGGFGEQDLQFAEIFSREIASALHTLELLSAEKHYATSQSVEAINRFFDSGEAGKRFAFSKTSVYKEAGTLCLQQSDIAGAAGRQNSYAKAYRFPPERDL